MSTDGIVSNSPEPGVAPQRKPARFDWRVGIIVLLAATSIPIYRAVHVNARGRALDQANAAPTVAVDRVRREDLAREITCEAELRPYQEIDVHAKVAGYLESIPVDIGDRVSAGQMLAKLEIPELQAEMDGAAAVQKRNIDEVGRARAVAEDAHMAYSRLEKVNAANPALVAAQELDTARVKDMVASSALSAAEAQVEVSNAEMSRLRTLQGYTRITAPFPGVITKRYADPGALIQAGTSSSTQTLPVVRLSQADLLRLSIPISVSYVSHVHVGDPAEIRLDSIGAGISGTIARLSGKVDTATRTMEAEVDVPNKDLRLIPGMYAVVHLRLDHRDNALTVPVQAVSHEEPFLVYIVDADNKIEARPVKIGLETPQRLEIVSGLKEREQVMIGDRTQVKPGELVKPKMISDSKPVP